MNPASTTAVSSADPPSSLQPSPEVSMGLAGVLLFCTLVAILKLYIKRMDVS